MKSKPQLFSVAIIIFNLEVFSQVKRYIINKIFCD